MSRAYDVEGTGHTRDPQAALIGLRMRILPALIASSAVFVPTIVAGSIFWARSIYASLHPGAFVETTQTISRVITHESIAGIFSAWITLAALVLGFSCWRILNLYRTAIPAYLTESRRRRIALALVVGMALAQAGSVFGMVLLSHYSLSEARDAHMASSYLFFIGQTLSILFSGIMCTMLARHGRDLDAVPARSGISLRLCAIRSPLAALVIAEAVLFLVLFIAKDFETPIGEYWIMHTYQWSEVVLILSFLVYLSTFTYEIYRTELARRLAARAQS